MGHNHRIRILQNEIMEQVKYKTVKLDHTTLGGTRLLCAENSISSEEKVECILLTQSKNAIKSSKFLVRDNYGYD